MNETSIRGYFGIGAEGISKAVNLSTLMRTAHAFGASFVFTIDTYYKLKDAVADTSKAHGQLPLYDLATPDELLLPRGCRLVGVEMTEDAVALPSFRHPLNAAYVLGPERGSLSPRMQARCEWIVRIPTRFCVNLGVAGSILMYDRMLCHGRFAERPVRAGGPREALKPHVHGRPILRHATESERERLDPSWHEQSGWT